VEYQSVYYMASFTELNTVEITQVKEWGKTNLVSKKEPLQIQLF
jgi:hypothetical protein